MAEAGEFTRRAYVLGKIRLNEAESLGNLLEAKNEGQLSLARNGMRGRLTSKMDELYLVLRSVLTGIYANIDFPDEDLADMSREDMLEALKNALTEINRLAATYKTGNAVSEGIPTVICGRTNAGKSSVYNRILGYDAAIVTDIEGTTRDVLRQNATLGKVTLLLCDTAGIRRTDDKVENIGIERSIKEIDEAGLILAVFDGSKAPDNDDKELVQKILSSKAAAVAIINKTDILANGINSELQELVSVFEHKSYISALTGEGFDSLSALVDEMFIDGTLDFDNDAIITGARQYAAISKAAELLSNAVCDIERGVSLDACCVEVECAMSALGELDGREIGEEIVHEIFSHFCVGK
jgi:tRNA modification GTPase